MFFKTLWVNFQYVLSFPNRQISNFFIRFVYKSGFLGLMQTDSDLVRHTFNFSPLFMGLSFIVVCAFMYPYFVHNKLLIRSYAWYVCFLSFLSMLFCQLFLTWVVLERVWDFTPYWWSFRMQFYLTVFFCSWSFVLACVLGTLAFSIEILRRDIFAVLIWPSWFLVNYLLLWEFDLNASVMVYNWFVYHNFITLAAIYHYLLSGWIVVKTRLWGTRFLFQGNSRVHHHAKKKPPKVESYPILDWEVQDGWEGWEFPLTDFFDYSLFRARGVLSLASGKFPFFPNTKHLYASHLNPRLNKKKFVFGLLIKMMEPMCVAKCTLRSEDLCEQIMCMLHWVLDYYKICMVLLCFMKILLRGHMNAH
jgi:hypothetical protein